MSMNNYTNLSMNRLWKELVAEGRATWLPGLVLADGQIVLGWQKSHPRKHKKGDDWNAPMPYEPHVLVQKPSSGCFPEYVPYDQVHLVWTSPQNTAILQSYVRSVVGDHTLRAETHNGYVDADWRPCWRICSSGEFHPDVFRLPVNAMNYESEALAWLMVLNALRAPVAQTEALQPEEVKNDD